MMKRNRLIFYSIFGFLHLFIFGLSFYVEYIGKHDTGQLFTLYGKIWALKYCSLVLLGLFITNVILHVRDNRRHTKEIDRLNADLTSLKARLFDQNEGKK